MRSEMKDEPCRCIEDGLQFPHQINWDTDEHTVAVVGPGVDECDHQQNRQVLDPPVKDSDMRQWLPSRN